MKIKELIGDNIVKIGLEATTKTGVIDELVQLLYKDGRISEIEGFKAEIIKREEIGSTGIGFGVAIPHAKTEYVVKPSLAFGLSVDGVDYDSMDGEPAHIVFMIAAPAEGANLHLQTLAKLSRKLIYDDFRDQLKNIKSKNELLKVLETIDEEEN